MRALFPLLFLVGCPEPSEPNTDTCATGTRQTWVISELTFARRDEGKVFGFDIDDTEASVCGHPDLESPLGEAGIDNNFSAIVPILEQTEAVAAENLIKQSIAAGELMLTLSLDGVDDWSDDSCVDFTLGRAGGVPLVAPDGFVLADQTLGQHDVIRPITVQGSAVDGRIDARGLRFNLPLDILNAELDFIVTDGAFWMQRRFDGAITGVMGGQIPVAQIIEILNRDDVNLQEFAPLVQAVADVTDEDGNCAGLSLGFQFVAIPIYLED